MPQVGGIDTSLSEPGAPVEAAIPSGDLLAPRVDLTHLSPGATASEPSMPSVPAPDASAGDVSIPGVDVKAPEVDASLTAPSVEVPGASESLPGVTGALDGASGALAGAATKVPGASGSVDPDAPKKKSRFSLPLSLIHI